MGFEPVGHALSLPSLPSTESSHSPERLARLYSNLDPERLRAVPLSICLESWGRHFRNEVEGAFSVDAANDHLSQKTEQIDNFLSHDWATSRFLKVLTLLWVFNIRAATIATFLISCILGFLRIYWYGTGSMMDHWCSTFFGYATFVIVFCWWQRIQSLFGISRKVFLDKLCIAQHNPALKQQGILGLAGFLQKSNTLTVMWSQRWATRLWCTYELAAFMRQGNLQIELMPVKLAGILLMQGSCWAAISIAHAIMASDGQEGDPDYSAYTLSLIGIGIFSVILIALTAVMVHTGLWLMKELDELPGQLKAFRIQDAACYCCAHGHRHPKTGKEIPCDREYVYWMLRTWFHDPEAPDKSHLDSFNAMVREQLAPVVLKHAGGSTLPLSYALYVCAACNLPWLIDYIPWWAAGYCPEEKAGFAFLLWWLRGLMLFLYHPLLQLAMMRICTMMWKALLPLAERTWRVALTAVQILIMIIVALAVWLAFRYVYQVTDSTSLLPGLPFVALVILDIALFWRSGERATASARPDHKETGPSSSHATDPEKEDVEKKDEDDGRTPGHCIWHISETEADGQLVEVKL
ncbi:unnamed protein product [Symbiodinium sp. CCMP2456]|nr:unnamed protein product [Symbiodinium sp. CCMP2456]